MKQKLHVFLMALLGVSVAFNLSAKKVSLEEAKYLANNVYQMHASANASFKASNVQLSSSFAKTDKNTNEVSCYIFNFEPAGFVILSAEDNYNSVLAFSDESNINVNDDLRNKGLWGVLSAHEQRIDQIRKNRFQAPEKIENEWKKIRLADQKSAKNTQQFDIVVPPLTTTKWDQGTYYNALLPADAEAGEDGKVWGGCVPLAMAQLIKYHNYPPKGNGNHTSSDTKYGTLSADFCGSTYNWTSMPDELTTYDNDVAGLIYDIGVATNTEYSPTYTSTYWNYVRDAMVDYFGFDHAATTVNDSDGTYFSSIARGNLDLNQPVVLTGDDLASGWSHCWVADGYGYFDTSRGTGQEYFHFNWGWRGDNNGWFLDNASYWAAMEGNPDLFDVIYYYKRKILYNIFPGRTECLPPGDLYTSALKETTTYINYFNRNLDEQIQFRYRVSGTAAWTEFAVTPNYYQYVGNLTPDTEYEYQVRRDCCGGVWSDYTDSKIFRTKGEGLACDNITAEKASSFYALAGYDMDTHDLYNNYYNKDGYEYVYGFVEKCNPWAAVKYYDCNAKLLDVEVPRGSPIAYLFQNNCDDIVPDCSNNTGTLFYDYCDNGEYYYFLEDENGVVYDPYFPEGSSFDFVNGTKVNFDFVYLGFYTCSIADGGPIQLTCVEYVGDGGAILQVYPWITDIVDPQNCNGESIVLYDLGNYTFLNVKDNRGNGTLYLYDGTYYCKDNASYNCPDVYGLSDSQIAETWTCGDGGGTVITPIDPPVDPIPSDDCPVLAYDLLNSAATSTSVYFYAVQPDGAIPNQFRYRLVGTTEWLYSDISDLYYKLVSGLTVGATYEYQMRQECSPGSWSSYTESFTVVPGGGLAAKGSQLNPMSLIEVTKLIEGNVIDLQVYPNPVKDLLFVRVENQLDNNNIQVYNIAGDLVKTVSVETEASLKTIEVTDLTAGMYFIEINNGGEIIHEKFIKE